MTYLLLRKTDCYSEQSLSNSKYEEYEVETKHMNFGLALIKIKPFYISIFMNVSRNVTYERFIQKSFFLYHKHVHWCTFCIWGTPFQQVYPCIFHRWGVHRCTGKSGCLLGSFDSKSINKKAFIFISNNFLSFLPDIQDFSCSFVALIARFSGPVGEFGAQ